MKLLTERTRSKHFSASIVVAFFVVGTLITCIVAYPLMFTGFAEYDDEGFMLISLRSFLEKGALYDQVYGQYGPFFYQFWGDLFRLLGSVMTHDAGRAATLVVWVASSLAIGAVTFHITTSVLLGVASQLLVFAVLTVLATEPMHPGGLTTALLALIALLSTRASHVAPGVFAVIGAATAALTLVKINVGLFALAAFLLVAASSYSIIRERWWLRTSIEVGFVLIPLLVMSSKIADSAAQRYLCHALIAGLALVLVLRSSDDRARRPNRELGGYIIAFVVVALLIMGQTLVAGTSLAGLVDGIVGQALRHAGVFYVPLHLPYSVLVFDLCALLAAIAYSWLRPNMELPGWSLLFGLIGIAVGMWHCIAVADWVVYRAGLSELTVERHPLGLAAFAWLVVIGDRKGPIENKQSFVRRLLAALAVLQGIHAYPVAGSQIGFASFLLVPIGLICLKDGFSIVVRTRPPAVRLASGAVVGAFLLFLTTSTILSLYIRGEASFKSSADLKLNGAQRIRVAPDKAVLYQNIAAAIKNNCDSVFTQPGMASFNFWSDIRPPTDQNVTFWTRLLSENLQRRIAKDLQRIEGLCLLRNQAIETRFWTRGVPIPETPLVHFFRDGFVSIGTFGDYELLKRSGPM